MTLREVVQRIQASQQLAETDPAAALQENRALFLDLLRQDQAYIVPDAEVSQEALDQKLFRPCIAPAQEDDPRLFLRVFSHEEPAAAFAERQGRAQLCKIDGVELAQLAKTYFLRGAYGFLLNDGSVWTALSFPDFLTGFYQDILGDPSLARPEFVALIQFINMVRQNYAYHIQAGRLTVQNAEKPLTLRFTDRPDALWTGDAGEWLYEDCKIDHLIRASKESNGVVLHIRTARIDLKIQPAYLRAALCAAGLDGQNTQPSLDFHTDAIALDYRMQDFDRERLPLQEQLAELPRPDKPEPKSEPEAPPEPKKKPKEPGQMKAKLAGLFAAATALFHKKKPDPEPDQPAEDDAQGPAPEGGEPATELDKEKKKFTLSPKLMVKGFALAAFLIVAIAFISAVLTPAPRDELEKALESGDYTATVEYYEKCVDRDPGSREELLQLLAADLGTKLAAYAADEIPAKQLAEVINTYSSISAMEDKCSAVYDQAADLEQSKTSYQKGLVETSIIARLRAWQGVIPEDTGSMTAVQTALTQNADAYKQMGIEETKSMKTAPAIAALTLLQTYYPGDKEVTDAILERKLEDSKPGQDIPSSVDGPLDDTVAEANWPVAVGELSAVYNAEAGSYDLYIPWENISGGEIESICFLVTALDANGQPVVSSGYNEDGEPVEYSQYLANMPSGPYEAGYQMPDNGYWQSAFTTDQDIASVRLDSVWVQIDGAGQTYIPTQEETEETASEESSNPLDELFG